MRELPNRKMPSIEVIAEYWAMRCLMCDSTYEGCKGRDPESGVGRFDHAPYWMFCDSGEPECARCEAFLGYVASVVKRESLPSSQKVRADRAHIVARWQVAYGDATELPTFNVDTVDNIVLLCHRCHKEDPETNNRRAQLDWMIAYRDERQRAKKAVDDLLDAGATYDSPAVEFLVKAGMPNWSERNKNAAVKQLQDLLNEKVPGQKV